MVLGGVTARERGDPIDDLDDVLHDRWSRLCFNAERCIDTPLRLGHHLTVVDVDVTSSDEMIVAGGTTVGGSDHRRRALHHNNVNNNNYVNDRDSNNNNKGIISLYQYHFLHSVSAKNRNAYPLVSLPLPTAVSAVKWFPYDSAMFLCACVAPASASVPAAERSPVVSVWDTMQFQPVSSIHVPVATSSNRSSGSGASDTLAAAATVVRGQSSSSSLQSTSSSTTTPTVTSLATATHPSARHELVAVAMPPVRHVTLIDLVSGSATHILQPQSDMFPVVDVAWSPTNPHLLAAAASDGTVSLFDVRRAGSVACLLTMDDRAQLLHQPLLYPVTTPTATKHSRPRPSEKDAYNDEEALNFNSPNAVNAQHARVHQRRSSQSRAAASGGGAVASPRSGSGSHSNSSIKRRSLGKSSNHREPVQSVVSNLLKQRAAARTKPVRRLSSQQKHHQQQQQQETPPPVRLGHETPIRYTLGLGSAWRDAPRRWSELAILTPTINKNTTTTGSNPLLTGQFLLQQHHDTDPTTSSQHHRRRRPRATTLTANHHSGGGFHVDPAVNATTTTTTSRSRMQVRFTPDGSTVVSSGAHGRDGVKAHDMLTGRVVADLPRHCPMFSAFDVAPDGLHLMTFKDGALFISDLMTGSYVNVSAAPVQQQQPYVHDFVLHHTDQCLVAVTGNAIEFWDCASAQQKHDDDDADEHE